MPLSVTLEQLRHVTSRYSLSAVRNAADDSRLPAPLEKRQVPPLPEQVSVAASRRADCVSGGHRDRTGKSSQRPESRNIDSRRKVPLKTAAARDSGCADHRCRLSDSRSSGSSNRKSLRFAGSGIPHGHSGSRSPQKEAGQDLALDRGGCIAGSRRRRLELVGQPGATPIRSSAVARPRGPLAIRRQNRRLRQSRMPASRCGGTRRTGSPYRSSSRPWGGRGF